MVRGYETNSECRATHDDYGDQECIFPADHITKTSKE